MSRGTVVIKNRKLMIYRFSVDLVSAMLEFAYIITGWSFYTIHIVNCLILQARQK